MGNGQREGREQGVCVNSPPSGQVGKASIFLHMGKGPREGARACVNSLPSGCVQRRHIWWHCRVSTQVNWAMTAPTSALQCWVCSLINFQLSSYDFGYFTFLSHLASNTKIAVSDMLESNNVSI
jgi:hypothetical protein